MQPPRARSIKKQVMTSTRQRLAMRGVVEAQSFNTEEIVMSSTTDKVKGVANEAIGNVKQGIGKAVDSDKLKVEGALQEAKGEAQQAVGKTKDALKKAIDG
jgi:uncharacterized protein YjbJ (UPF0337 family)